MKWENYLEFRRDSDSNKQQLGHRKGRVQQSREEKGRTEMDTEGRLLLARISKTMAEDIWVTGWGIWGQSFLYRRLIPNSM